MIKKVKKLIILKNIKEKMVLLKLIYSIKKEENF